jgi:hypothetical protein
MTSKKNTGGSEVPKDSGEQEDIAAEIWKAAQRKAPLKAPKPGPPYFSILNQGELLKGRTYSDWIVQWSNNLLSRSPDIFENGEMLFARGNVSYKDDDQGSRLKEPGGFLNRMEDRGYNIPADGSIFIPVITAMYSEIDSYEGKQTDEERHMRYAARTDLSEGREMWLIYKKRQEDGKWPAAYTVVTPDLEKFVFESSYFTLNVDESSPLRLKLEYPMEKGKYDAVTHGYFVILHDITSGTYRFNFGGKGRGEYYTHCGLDVTIGGEISKNSLDISSKPNLIPRFDAEKLTMTTGVKFTE